MVAPKKPLQKLRLIPAPKIAFPQFSTKTLKIPKSKLFISLLASNQCFHIGYLAHWRSLPR